MKTRFYFSNRNLPLIYYGEPSEKPVITVENYLKWYDLYLVLPTGSVERISFGEH